MTGLILAAGMGKRLAPLTDERPKGLIELGGRSILARLLDGLQAAGVRETALVVGYRQEAIRAALGDAHRGMPVRYLVNPAFEKGPRLSLWTGRAEFERDDVVLADGTLLRLGGRTIKDVAGYDLKRLFVGSEGTLGVITRATLRLRPLPPPAVTMVATFASVEAAGRAVSGIVASQRPATLELMDRTTVRAVEDYRPRGLDVDAGATLLVQSDAGPAGASELAAVEAVCAAQDATYVAVTDEGALREHFELPPRRAVAKQRGLGEPRERFAPIRRSPQPLRRHQRHAHVRYRIPAACRRFVARQRLCGARSGMLVAHEQQVRRGDLGREREVVVHPPIL